jgi:hypothetical protein
VTETRARVVTADDEVLLREGLAGLHSIASASTFVGECGDV